VLEQGHLRLRERAKGRDAAPYAIVARGGKAAAEKPFPVALFFDF